MLHLHFPDGELIRTTPEHPFWVEHKGWTAAGALKEGDRIATLSGEWVAVAEVFDTQEWEPVYNIRVADFHTYFVGDDGWGLAAWAHNHYSRLVEVLRNAPEVATATDETLLKIAQGMPQAASAKELSLAAFTAKLETKLRNQQLLGSGKHLSPDTALAAKAAAEVHGNEGRSPTIGYDPSAPNPYKPNTIAYRHWNEIQALQAAHPTTNAWRLQDLLVFPTNSGQWECGVNSQSKEFHRWPGPARRTRPSSSSRPSR